MAHASPLFCDFLLNIPILHIITRIIFILSYIHCFHSFKSNRGQASLLQISDCRFQIPNSRLQIPDSRLQVSGSSINNRGNASFSLLNRRSSHAMNSKLLYPNPRLPSLPSMLSCSFSRSVLSLCLDCLARATDIALLEIILFKLHLV